MNAVVPREPPVEELRDGATLIICYLMPSAGLESEAIASVTVVADNVVLSECCWRLRGRRALETPATRRLCWLWSETETVTVSSALRRVLERRFLY